MKLIGNIRKLKSHLKGQKVFYELPLGKKLLPLNDLLGKELHLHFTGKINCMECAKTIRKSYAQGYCYDCFTRLPQTDVGVLHPEKDLSFLGISRDIEWAQKNSLIPHFVYLSFTDKVKVGVTRHTQIPTRWIDQGASEAIILAQTPNRHIAGVIEVYLKQFFADKTSWQQMLTQSDFSGCNLLEEKQKGVSLLHPELKQYVYKNNEIMVLEFPMQYVPTTVKSLKLEAKTPDICKNLQGIKGQYLLFEDDTVLNIRNLGGYEIEIQC